MAHNHHDGRTASAWKRDGVCVVPANQLDTNTAQTSGMDRKAAIGALHAGARGDAADPRRAAGRAQASRSDLLLRQRAAGAAHCPMP